MANLGNEDPRPVPTEPLKQPDPPNEDPGLDHLDESPRLPPADEDSKRGGSGGNSRGVSRPQPSTVPTPTGAW